MKKLAIALFLSCLAVTSYGQGRFAWASSGGTALDNIYIQALVDGPTAIMPTTASGQYVFGLFVSTSSTDPTQMTPLAYGGVSGTAAGRISATQISDNNTYNVQVRGWSAAAGATWDIAGPIIASKSDPNILYGESGVGRVVPTASPATAPNIWTTAGTPIDGFILAPIPEPSTLGLIGLGLLGLIAIRRRK